MSSSSDDSSSSGEEIVNPSEFGEDGDVEEDNVTENTEPSQNDATSQKVKWRNDDISKLANCIFTQMSSGDVLLPYDKVSVDWEEVGAEIGKTGKECEVKWQSLLHSIRTYRTLPEVIDDVLTLCSKMSIAKYNKEIVKAKENDEKVAIAKPKKSEVNKATRSIGTATSNGAIKSKVKKPVNPNHPKKPPGSGYMLFVSKCNIKDSGVQRMLKLGAMWKAMTEAERKKYNDDCTRSKERYFQKLQQYAAKNPGDIEIQKILEEELKHRSKKSKSEDGGKEPGNKSNSSIPTSPSIKGNSTADDTLVSTESDLATLKKSPKKSPKKRHQEDTNEEVETPSKKKKNKKKAEKSKVFTGEDIYVQKKFDMYKEDHSDMEDNDIQEKLRKKYRKLPEEKQARYIRIAEENNT